MDDTGGVEERELVFGSLVNGSAEQCKPLDAKRGLDSSSEVSGINGVCQNLDEEFEKATANSKCID